MKTFRFSLVALIATALFTACTNDAVLEPVSKSGAAEISFRLQGGTPETRALATTGDNIEALVVYGTDNVTRAAGVNIFDGITVARQKDNTFSYNPKKYYSVGATTADFFAYSPVSANISSLTNATPLLTNASFDYEVKAPDATGNIAQEDLLVVGKRVAPSTTAVSLLFEHALSRVFVKAINELDETVVITGLALKNAYSTGTITGTPAATWAWVWSNHDDKREYKYELAPSGVAVRSGSAATLVTSMEQGMMLLPQETLNAGDDDVWNTNDFALEVTYDAGNIFGATAYVLLEDGFEFEAGKQYSITIKFSGDDLIEIEFDIDVDPFGTPIEEVIYP
jgi:hypothetical protein